MKKLGVRPRVRQTTRTPVEDPVCGTVGLLFVDDSYLCHPSLVLPQLRCVEQTLTAAGVNLVLAHITAPELLPPVILSGQIDGLLLWGYQSPGGVLDKLRHLPAVWLTSHSDDLGAMVMAVGFFEPARQAPGDQRSGRRVSVCGPAGRCET